MDDRVFICTNVFSIVHQLVPLTEDAVFNLDKYKSDESELLNIYNKCVIKLENVSSLCNNIIERCVINGFYKETRKDIENIKKLIDEITHDSTKYQSHEINIVPKVLIKKLIKIRDISVTFNKREQQRKLKGNDKSCVIL
jgi:hypothetical protein